MKDLTMDKEIMLEKASFVLGKFYEIKDENKALEILHNELWKLKDEILLAEEKRLAEISTVFSVADKVITGVREDGSKNQ